MIGIGVWILTGVMITIAVIIFTDVMIIIVAAAFVVSRLDLDGVFGFLIANLRRCSLL